MVEWSTLVRTRLDSEQVECPAPLNMRSRATKTLDLTFIRGIKSEFASASLQPPALACRLVYPATLYLSPMGGTVLKEGLVVRLDPQR
jgi:hypothetical protein